MQLGMILSLGRCETVKFGSSKNLDGGASCMLRIYDIFHAKAGLGRR